MRLTGRGTRISNREKEFLASCPPFICFAIHGPLLHAFRVPARYALLSCTHPLLQVAAYSRGRKVFITHSNVYPRGYLVERAYTQNDRRQTPATLYPGLMFNLSRP